MKCAIAPVLLLATLAFGQTWVVEQVDSAAASGSPVELVKAADGRLWAGYQTESGVVRVACLGDSGWNRVDVRTATLPSEWRPFFASGPHGELSLSCYDFSADSGWLYRMVGDTWHGAVYPFMDSSIVGTVAYGTAGRLYTAFSPSAGHFWVGHETDSGWTAGLAATLLYFYDPSSILVAFDCLTVAADGSPWNFAYHFWAESEYHWGEESALMHFIGDTWVRASGWFAPLALVPRGDSVGWVSTSLVDSLLLCDGDTIASGVGGLNAGLAAGLAYATGDVPLVAWIQTNVTPKLTFKTNRWHTEGIPGPAGEGGIDIEVDNSGQVVIVYSTQGSGLWCARAMGSDVIGVKESPKPQASCHKPAATVLSGASDVGHLASSIVFDVMGRRVLNPRSGVCFLRSASSVGRDASGVTKVVIQR